MIISNINTFGNIIKSSEEFLLSFLQLTGVPGIEPGSGVLETLILPMNYTPVLSARSHATIR